MIGTSQPLETHITSSPYILKVFDILHVVSGHMVLAKHSYSMLVGTMCNSLEHISDQYDMVEARDHCRVDYTSILYIRSVLAPSTVVGTHKDVTPLCCSYQ